MSPRPDQALYAASWLQQPTKATADAGRIPDITEVGPGCTRHDGCPDRGAATGGSGR